MIERPEHRLLLACARICGDAERRDLTLSCVSRRMDWEYLLQMAARHAITSLLFNHVNTICQDVVPDGILARLHSHFVKSAKNNLFLTSDLLKILYTLERNGITAIPFKGPVLAHSLYENPALREFGDLDILIQTSNVFRALKLLPSLGYQKIREYPPMVEAQILRLEYHYQIRSEDRGPLVELHWNVAPHYFVLPLVIEGWWQRTQLLQLEQRRVQNLSAEDLLMALSVHGCRHLWESLGWITDVSRLLAQNGKLDWDYILKEYHDPDLKRMIFLSLIVAHDLTGAPVEKEIIKQAKEDPVVLELAQEVAGRLFGHGAEAEGLHFNLFQLRLKSRWIDRIRYCYRLVTRPTLIEWNVALPRFLFPLYFFLRPIRLIRKTLNRVFSPQRY